MNAFQTHDAGVVFADDGGAEPSLFLSWASSLQSKTQCSHRGFEGIHMLLKHASPTNHLWPNLEQTWPAPLYETKKPHWLPNGSERSAAGPRGGVAAKRSHLFTAGCSFVLGCASTIARTKAFSWLQLQCPSGLAHKSREVTPKKLHLPLHLRL